MLYRLPQFRGKGQSHSFGQVRAGGQDGRESRSNCENAQKCLGGEGGQDRCKISIEVIVKMKKKIRL